MTSYFKVGETQCSVKKDLLLSWKQQPKVLLFLIIDHGAMQIHYNNITTHLMV